MDTESKMPDRTQARRLVEDIFKKHGYLSQEILNQMSPEVRAAVEEAMSNKDLLIASTVKTLAKNLYTTSARFVFELLQNCDDNDYSKARAEGNEPYVSFSVYPDRIIMECNEDGFSAENLIAICNVGKSSKSGAQGYIGEKGIGFKSVFMAAYEVHIQSGHFSFFFQHREGDSGMGMITPVWEEPGDDVAHQLTRITLLLHDAGDQDVLETRRKTIRQQFRELHDSILLFMKNMKRINIVFYGDHEEELTITHSIDRQTDNRVAVHKSTSEDGEDQECVKHYHMTKHVATKLAKNENREYSDLENQTKAYSKSDVLLAFPIEDNSPLLENQWIFAFLPVRQMGFKFLIQADFVTQANRQDIVTTSARNRGLATGIAEAFIKAVLQFCEHDKLQYRWMRYLPQEDGYPWDEFWTSVIDEIGDRLKRTPVLRPAKPGPLRSISASRAHSSDTLDKYGKPLFADIAPELYLCLDYQDRDLELLEKHGLKYMGIERILDRVEHDLAASDSRMKSINDEDWHSRAARLLNSPFEMSWSHIQKDVKRLSLLPLRDGRWSSIESSAVYYSRIKGRDLDIPVDLDLDVLHPKLVDNEDRKKLFDSIGVTHASPSSIRKAILKKYGTDSSIKSKDAASHLRFLYLTEKFVEPPYDYDRILLRPEEGGYFSHEKKDFYIRDEIPYGAGELLKSINPGPNTADGAPGFDVLFVHGAYFEHVPGPPTENSLSWKGWFQKHFHVRRNLRLIHREKTQLSDMCKYVAQYRPDKFVGFLRAIWQVEPPSRSQEKDIVEELGGLEVLCIGGEMCPLRSTYLPFKKLQQLCSLFLLDDEFFPWLRLETDLDYDNLAPEWQKLGEIFGLGFNQSDTTIILDILRCLLDQNIFARDIIKPERVYELYIYLQVEVRKSSEPNGGEKVIREYFASREAIFVPESTTQEASWALPEECVWESPIEMTTKHSLAKLYEIQFQKFNTDRSNLAGFFGKTVGIPNCNWEHLVAEVRDFKASNCTDFDRINALYLCLESKCVEADSANKLREIFQVEALICGFDNQATSWHKTTHCLWTSATQITGMCTLKDLYSDLKGFFTKILRVKKMTVKMVYDKLVGPGLSEADARQTLETFNSLLLTIKDNELDPTPVLQNEVFPVSFPDGNVRLLKGSDSFALLDRESLGDDFHSQAKFLDFSIEKTQALYPFIKWSRLEDRFLSKSVTEISSASEETTRPISSPDREIKLKARALLSIAVTYNSPRARGDRKAFYNLLRRAKTLETDKITSELHLNQDGNLLRVEKASAMLHIQEDKASLKVYLPRNERSQEFCFNSKLPRLFGEWMMTDPVTRIAEPVRLEVVAAIQSVLSVKSIALPDVLDDHGIILIDVVEEEAQEFEDNYDMADPSEPRTSAHLNEELVQHPISDRERNNVSDDDDPGIDTPPSSVHSPGVGRASRSEELSSTSAVTRYAASRPEPHLNMPLASLSQYSALLSKVIEGARRASFPSRGVYNMSAIHAALEQIMLGEEDDAVPFRLRSTSQIERDKQIGAAGELFAFEFLSHLNPSLSSFSIANWQSTIRSYVTSHPEYSNISPWTGREKADIMYTDNNSTLTGLFIDKGYLPSNIWAGAKPQYYIEVKTTTGACETPFYMSKYQYNRMQNLSTRNTETRQTHSIYVIFRVFNLGSDCIGLKLLVDPETMRLRDELEFTAETWSVIARG